MDQLIPPLTPLLEPCTTAFRPEVFEMFCLTVGAWIVCLGRRTISRVWETTGRSATHDHSAAFRLFSAAVWNWDEVCRILICAIFARLVPGMRIWIVVDDTLCHKRGAKVAFGGIFLDAGLSSKRHKVFRFGTNWVSLGLVVSLPIVTVVSVAAGLPHAVTSRRKRTRLLKKQYDLTFIAYTLMNIRHPTLIHYDFTRG